MVNIILENQCVRMWHLHPKKLCSNCVLPEVVPQCHEHCVTAKHKHDQPCFDQKLIQLMMDEFQRRKCGPPTGQLRHNGFKVLK